MFILRIPDRFLWLFLTLAGCALLAVFAGVCVSSPDTDREERKEEMREEGKGERKGQGKGERKGQEMESGSENKTYAADTK